MRVAPAEYGVYPQRLALPFQRLQPVREQHQVHLGRQLVRRMIEVGIAEQAELPAGDEARELLAHRLEIGGRVVVPVRCAFLQVGGRGRVGLACRYHVYPVHRSELVEMRDMVLNQLRAHHQVADVPRVGRDGVAERVLHGAHRGQRMHHGAYAADALGKSPSIAWIAPLQDDFDAAHHRAAGGCFCDHAGAVGLGLDAQVSFDARDGINNNGAHSLCSLIWLDSVWRRVDLDHR